MLQVIVIIVGIVDMSKQWQVLTKQKAKYNHTCLNLIQMRVKTVISQNLNNSKDTEFEP